MAFTTKQAMDACAAFPAVQLSYPFGEETPVFKVVGRVFAILNAEEGPGEITLKADPEDAKALVATFADIRPGYHMNKKHWTSVTLPTTKAPVGELVRDSYDLVVAGMPRGEAAEDVTGGAPEHWARVAPGGCVHAHAAGLAPTP